MKQNRYIFFLISPIICVELDEYITQIKYPSLLYNIFPQTKCNGLFTHIFRSYSINNGVTL